MKKIILSVLLIAGYTQANSIKEYYPNGGLKSKLVYDTKQDGCKIQTYYRNGNLKKEASYSNNKKCNTLG